MKEKKREINKDAGVLSDIPALHWFLRKSDVVSD